MPRLYFVNVVQDIRLHSLKVGRVQIQFFKEQFNLTNGPLPNVSYVMFSSHGCYFFRNGGDVNQCVHLTGNSRLFYLHETVLIYIFVNQFLYTAFFVSSEFIILSLGVKVIHISLSQSNGQCQVVVCFDVVTVGSVAAQRVNLVGTWSHLLGYAYVHFRSVGFRSVGLSIVFALYLNVFAATGILNLIRTAHGRFSE